MPGRRRNPFESVAVVFFDAGGTLLVPAHDPVDAYVDALARLGQRRGRTAVRRAFEAAKRLLEEPALRASLDQRERFDLWREKFFTRLNLDLDAQALEHEVSRIAAEAGESELGADPEAAGVLEALGRSGYRLGVISNWSVDLPGLLDQAGVGRFFEHVVTSDEVGATKPDKRIFTQALARMRVAPARALMVGDDYRADVVGARESGMHALLVDRRARHRSIDEPAIRSLTELPGLLASGP